MRASIDLKPSDIVNVLISLLGIILASSLIAFALFTLPIFEIRFSGNILLYTLIGSFIGTSLTVGLLVYHVLRRQRSEISRIQQGLWDYQINLEEELKPSIEIESWSIDPAEIEVEVSNVGDAIAEDLEIGLEIQPALDDEITSQYLGLPLHRVDENLNSNTLQPHESNVIYTAEILSELPENVRRPFEQNRVNEIDFRFSLTYESALGSDYSIPLFTIAISEGIQQEDLRSILDRGKTIVHSGEEKYQDELTRSERGEDEPRILVVDDEPEIADLYAQWLSTDYYVQTAYSSEGARRLIDEDIDLMIVDRRMPGDSGDDLIFEIRGQGYEFPIIVLSAVEPNIDVLELPIQEYIIKPVSSEELLDMTEAVLRRQQFDETIREYFHLVTKMSLVEASIDQSELIESEEYSNIKATLENYRMMISEHDNIDLERHLQN